MIVGTSVTIQVSGSLAIGLFDRLGATGVSAMRFALAAVFLLVGVRPTLRRRARATWQAIVLYGVSLAGAALAPHEGPPTRSGVQGLHPTTSE